MLGWRYEGAEEESQRYKVGKYILETKCVVGWSSWELESVFGDGGGGVGRGGDEGVEFDSQDEEECEDLFAGVWTARGARRRRDWRWWRRRRGCAAGRGWMGGGRWGKEVWGGSG